MKKVFLLLVVISAATMYLVGCSKGYESQKTAGDLKIVLAAKTYPLVKGDNTLTVKLMDAAGKDVTDAKVDVRYYMPAMPGMAPMEYTTQALISGSTYPFTVNIPMEGGWRVDLTANRGGAALPTVTFNIDAR